MRLQLTNDVGSLFYPVGDLNALTEKILLSVARCKLLDQGVTTRLSDVTQLLVRKALQGYADILETILPKPSDTMLPNQISEISGTLIKDWTWELFPDINGVKPESTHLNKHSSIVFMLEQLLNNSNNVTELPQSEVNDYDLVSQDAWNEERLTSLADDMERQEEEQVRKLSFYFYLLVHEVQMLLVLVTSAI